MRGEDVDGRAVDIDGQVGVRLGGQGEALEHLVGVPARAVVVGRQESARHVLPQEVAEGADLVRLDGVLGVDGETVLPRELAEAPGVARAGGRPVLVQVEAAGHAGVHGTRPGVGVRNGGSAVVGDFEVVRAEEVDGLPLCVVVELVDEEDVGVDSLDGLRDVRRLLVAAGGEVGEELPVRVAVETGVEGGDRQSLGRGRLGGLRQGGAGRGGAEDQGQAGRGGDRSGLHH